MRPELLGLITGLAIGIPLVFLLSVRDERQDNWKSSVEQRLTALEEATQ